TSLFRSEPFKFLHEPAVFELPKPEPFKFRYEPSAFELPSKPEPRLSPISTIEQQIGWIQPRTGQITDLIGTPTQYRIGMLNRIEDWSGMPTGAMVDILGTIRPIFSPVPTAGHSCTPQPGSFHGPPGY
ncbi:MAG: hypothetical protein ACJ8GN_05755, partial [Longimicrobiaceae bacterium]